MSAATQLHQLIVTGSTGLVGASVVREAKRLCPGIMVTEIRSARKGGVNLVAAEAWRQLTDSVAVPQPQGAALIHCAADLAVSGDAVKANNAAMTANVARWAKEAGIGFVVYVSSVSVYPSQSFTLAETPPAPSTDYGESKLMGEGIWRDLLPSGAIVRLAGVLGWQAEPTMFWNRLLLRALQPASSFEFKPGAARNYITAPEAAECLIQVALNRLTGTHLAAGLETVTMGEFVALLEAYCGHSLGGKALQAGPDAVVYEPSAALAGWLKPFRNRLEELWSMRPNSDSLGV